MRPDHYILDDNDRVITVDLMTWARWMDSPKRIVKQEWIGDSRVSTVFLGLDHSFLEIGPPILWETMVFNGKLDREMDRCAGNREQAEAMHERMAALVREVDKVAPAESLDTTHNACDAPDQ